MRVKELKISGSWLVENEVLEDTRGTFSETFNRAEFLKASGFDFIPVQVNQSTSSAKVIRGIHYSLAPQGQAKWVSCLTGSILDVIVDLRKSSKTFGEWEIIQLVGGDSKALVLSPGLGHGFLSLADNSTVNYLLTSHFDSSLEHGINPMDKNLGIDWNVINPILSEKDRVAPTLEIAKNLNNLPN
jgi:dTDP-4-dehydrorhamnose 3,5-epimerase